ncbi:hypothetical protein [Nocardioides rubriscoriae]|uniref:hypothetical protein n=1 Tax=Nocardioides rubriscoriae TaxID=642762 RepID=UPI0011E0095E|nr:hypothetical protein [Nocardioides rubriscoriae]
MTERDRVRAPGTTASVEPGARSGHVLLWAGPVAAFVVALLLAPDRGPGSPAPRFPQPVGSVTADRAGDPGDDVSSPLSPGPVPQPARRRTVDPH